jgi:hypothetical protein
LYLSVARSYSLWDAIAIWSVKGYGIALNQSVFAAREWGGHGLDYPLNLPILISLFQLAGGDSLPASKAIFPLFYASALFAVYGFLRGRGVGREISLLGTLLLASLPLLFSESTSGYANAPFTVYLLLGGLSLLLTARTSARGDYLVAGSMLGLASWTRVEGILYAVAILASGLGVFAILGHLRPRWGWVAVPLSVVAGPWFVFHQLFSAGSSQGLGALRAAAEAIPLGQFHLGPLRLVVEQVVRSTVNEGAWGYAWLLAGVLLILGYRQVSGIDRAQFWASMGMFAAIVSVTVLLFYVGSFGVADFRGWLARSFARELLPAPLFLLTGAFVLFRGRPPASILDGPRPDRGSLSLAAGPET